MTKVDSHNLPSGTSNHVVVCHAGNPSQFPSSCLRSGTRELHHMAGGYGPLHGAFYGTATLPNSLYPISDIQGQTKKEVGSPVGIQQK